MLEPHILAALYPTVQHVIALGDPEQLRPLINRYGEDSWHVDQVLRVVWLT